MKKNIAGFAAVLVLVILLNSCTLNNSGSTTTVTQQGHFLIAQTSPDAPSLAFLTNNNILDTGLNYRAYSPFI